MNVKERKKILAMVRTRVAETGTTTAQLAEVTGLHISTCYAMLSKKAKYRSKVPNNDTAELLKLWLDLSKGGKPAVVMKHKPDGWTPADEKKASEALRRTLDSVEDELYSQQAINRVLTAKLDDTLEENKKLQRQRDKLLELL